jgi:tRNA dimethylallyltransferase
LYGALKGSEVGSAALWREMALAEINWCQEHNLKPIIVGGTGLYFLALLKGLSEVPDVDPDVRQAARDLCAQLGAPAFYQRLIQMDPLIEGRLNPNDSQRLIRAYEVVMGTSRSLIEWQSSPPTEPGLACEMMVIERSRDVLHQRAEARFDQMLAAGAVEEVEKLLEKNYDPELPVMRALGVKELSSYIKGDVNLPQARELAIIATRQYIKRQSTFFRNQFPHATRIEL